jgi:hypothetical protein
MPPDSIIVFINAQRVDVPAGSTALDAVRRWNAESAAQIASGTRQLSDARGLPIDADTLVYGGAIFRVTGGRRGVAAAPGGDES